MFWILLACVLTGAHGALQFASYYQDHMVLQRGPQRAVVWGNAMIIGDNVTVQVSGHRSVTGKVRGDLEHYGTWKVKLPAITDKGPFTVTATSSEGTVTIQDVLFGDVWFCAGQSNMEFRFHSVINYTAELATALAYTDVRVLKLQRYQSPTPLRDVSHGGGIEISWSQPSSWEANVQFPDYYACQFPAMINDWREKFHNRSLGETSADFPFGFVQLAGHHESETFVGGFPRQRWAQTAFMGEAPNELMRKVFMAVAMDLPDYDSPHGSIHPRYKQDVSRRLRLGARAIAYNDTTVQYQGPFPRTVTQEKTHRTIHIVYDHGPIQVRNNKGFEVCCSDSRTCGFHKGWVAAPIQSYQASELVISTAECITNHAVGVRYAWRESPCDFKQCSIYGKNTSLPAPPYFLVPLEGS